MCMSPEGGINLISADRAAVENSSIYALYLGSFFFRVRCRLASLVEVEERSWFNRCSSERGGWSGRNDDDHGARKNENRKETMGICLPCYTCRKAYKQVGAFWAGNAMPGGYNRNLIIDKSVRKMDWIFKLRNSPKQSEI